MSEEKKRIEANQRSDNRQSKERNSRNSSNDKRYSDKNNLTKGRPFSIKFR